MQNIGIFTLCLRLCRRLLNLLPRLLEYLATFNGGLISEIVLLFAIWVIFSKAVDFFCWVAETVLKLLKKFE